MGTAWDSFQRSYRVPRRVPFKGPYYRTLKYPLTGTLLWNPKVAFKGLCSPWEPHADGPWSQRTSQFAAKASIVALGLNS